jgi:hypothetical protein
MILGSPAGGAARGPSCDTPVLFEDFFFLGAAYMHL